jgi:hypothetical protein
MNEFREISKVEVAISQLDTAISFYLENSNLISAVTLAGAAEEILGKLVIKEGKVSAFNEVLERLCCAHEAAFNEEPSRKVYADLRNGIRNEFKHRCSGEDLQVDLDKEASQLIKRAIANYKKLFPGYYPRFKEFETEWLKRNQ